jgi:hypothetical protein
MQKYLKQKLLEKIKNVLRLDIPVAEWLLFICFIRAWWTLGVETRSIL